MSTQSLTFQLLEPSLSLLRDLLPSNYFLLGSDSLTLGAILVSTTLFVVAICVFAISQRKSRAGLLLICGASNSGKTVFYNQLRFRQTVETQLSLKESRAQFGLTDDEGIAIEKGPIDVIDVPGHERLRYRSMDFLPNATAIAFVIDATTIGKEIRTVGEYLYDILVHPHVRKSALPILIVCNKSDMVTAHKAERVKTMLEHEINNLRSTRTASLDQQESPQQHGNSEDNFLGYEGQDFTFEDVPNVVAVEEISAVKGEIRNAREWIVGAMGRW